MINLRNGVQEPRRDNGLIELRNCCVVYPTYPNCIISTCNKLINPYDERIMSLNVSSGSSAAVELVSPTKTITESCYFFIYNFDNYFHFLYDTVPLLYYYLTVLESKPKLLLGAAFNQQRPYVRETFELLGIKEEDCIMADEATEYSTLYVSTSWTHGMTTDGMHMSNAVPSIEAHYVWRLIAAAAGTSSCHPKKIYVSRRSWIHGEMANIGTNYTTRRKCMNEDAVVALLEEHGYKETFLELMTMRDKIAMFAAAESVIGVIGGGMCNLIFSPESTKAVCLVTPDFDKINERFNHSMNHTRIQYLYNCTHYYGPDPPPFPLYSRIRVVDPSHEYYNMIGETEEWCAESRSWTVRMSKNDVAGFAADRHFPLIVFTPEQLIPIDNGLNSPYLCDIDMLKGAL